MSAAPAPDEDETIAFIKGVHGHIGPMVKPRACHFFSGSCSEVRKTEERAFNYHSEKDRRPRLTYRVSSFLSGYIITFIRQRVFKCVT